ncbi:MAG: hypothetical protein ACI9JN_001356 [Bacteroidia bacterium]|jgi:hypothetical protein
MMYFAPQLKSIMKIVKSFVLILSIFGLNSASAQTEVILKYSSESALTVNGLQVTSSTKPSELIAVLGTASRTIENKHGETAYYYDAVGLMFASKADVVNIVGVNYNWDGDEKFPKTSFTGSLSLGELSVTKETVSKDVAGIKNVTFKCPIPLMCLSEDQTVEVKCAVAFNKKKLSQIVFLIADPSKE